MGVCLNVCPTGALTIVERESAAYSPAAAREHVALTRGAEAALHVHPGPGAAQETAGLAAARAPSELAQWPIQLHLITPQAPYFKGADLLVAADCTAFTRGSFHSDLLRGHRLVIACPKLDDVTPYVDKLAELIRVNEPPSITVALMTVPCCGGLQRIVERAVSLSEVDVPVKTVMIGLDGEITADA
jgi:ferredoxin